MNERLAPGGLTVLRRFFGVAFALAWLLPGRLALNSSSHNPIAHKQGASFNTWWSSTTTSQYYQPFIAQDFSSGDPWNGNFERGSGVGWQGEDPTHKAIINSGFPDTVTPHSGSWAACFDSFIQLYQWTTVPTGNQYLTFWFWIIKEGGEWDQPDWLGVWVDGWCVGEIRVRTPAQSTGGWLQAYVDLTHPGSTWLSFDYYNNNTQGISYLCIDDVFFSAAPAGGKLNPCCTIPPCL